VRLNSSDRGTLLRVPGIGPETVRRILNARREGRIRSIDALGVRGKRADTIRKYVIFE
jgi:predicted DNA-binding helix-hairpin-helix protein